MLKRTCTSQSHRDQKCESIMRHITRNRNRSKRLTAAVVNQMMKAQKSWKSIVWSSKNKILQDQAKNNNNNYPAEKELETLNLKSQARITTVESPITSSKKFPMKMETLKTNSKRPKKKSITPKNRSAKPKRRRSKLKNRPWRSKDTMRSRFKKLIKKLCNKWIKKTSLRKRKPNSILKMSRRRPIRKLRRLRKKLQMKNAKPKMWLSKPPKWSLRLGPRSLKSRTRNR